MISVVFREIRHPINFAKFARLELQSQMFPVIIVLFSIIVRVRVKRFRYSIVAAMVSRSAKPPPDQCCPMGTGPVCHDTNASR